MNISSKLSTIFLLLLCACKFTYSPYEVGHQNLFQNDANLRVIQNQEAQFGTEFKIAFISDTHNYYDEMKDLVKTINQSGPYSFVVVTGDLTNQGLLSEYKKSKEYLDTLNYPYLVAVGNHDLLSNGEEIFEEMFGVTDFGLVYKDLHLIIFNNNNWEKGGTVPDMNFLESQLSTSTSPFKILIAHIPPDTKERFSEREILNMEALVSNYGVDYFFNGHIHAPGETMFSSAINITVGSPQKRVYQELIKDINGLTHKKINF